MTHTPVKEKKMRTIGSVERAFGNLLQVKFSGNLRQGEVAMVHLDGLKLKAEVIEIAGNVAKIQVYEDTKGIKYNTPVEFSGDLLEAELGPGLLTSIFDGLQNPLERVANKSGLFLPRGVYINAIDRQRQWNFEPTAKVGDLVERGDFLGTTMEGRFHHYIMVPFNLYGKYKLTWVIGPGSYNVDTVVAKAKDEAGKEYEFHHGAKMAYQKCSLYMEKKSSPPK